MIRVLNVFSTLDRGGAESMCMNIYRHIDREKIQFDFVKHTIEEGDFEKEIIHLGGRIFTAPRFNGRNIIKYFFWWRLFFSNHPEYKMIHGHFFTISPIYFLAAKLSHRTTIAHIHATHVTGVGKNLLISLIPFLSDVFFACSEKAGKWVYGSRHFIIIRNALDIEKFRFDNNKRERVREELELNNQFVIGTVANYFNDKNPFGLLKICKEIHGQNPQSKLIWIGDGLLKEQIEESIRISSMKDYVILLGKRHDVPDLLQAMDAFLLPSFHEGLPVSIIEAQAAGLPCYISDTVTREADISGLCTFLPIDQANKWAEIILSDNRRRIDTIKLIEQAGYDIKKTARWIEDFYISLAAKC